MPAAKFLYLHYPELAKQWDKAKNAPAQLEQVRSGDEATSWWWTNEHGHSFTATARRMVAGQRCSICTGHQVAPDTALQNLRSDLAAQWSSENDRPANSVTLRSNYKALWNGTCGHQWRATVASRTGSLKSQPTGCPVCANVLIVPEINSFEALQPLLMQEWDWEANDVLPSDISEKSSALRSWKCSKHGHPYTASPSARVVRGQGCPYCAGKKVLAEFNDLGTVMPKMAAQWHPTKNGSVTPQMVTRASNFRATWRCDVEPTHEWTVRVCDRFTYTTDCPHCAAHRYASKPEVEVADFLEAAGVEVTRNAPRVFGQYEGDIWIKSLGIVVEFNGLYWHSEALKDKHYHQRKQQAAAAAGMQLIQIWEDDWRDRKDLVQRMLLHKIGASNSPRVHARKTSVVEVDRGLAREFLSANHLQGPVASAKHFGLKTAEGELVAVMALRKEAKQVNLLRFATSTSVPGSFTKLLSAARRAYPGQDFLTFADLCVSDGSLYEQSGFEMEKVLEPDYAYFTQSSRFHKFTYRIQRFREDPKLTYEPGKTEAELAAMNGLLRIWDAGKIRYRLRSQH